MNQDHLDRLIEEENRSLIEAHSLSEEKLQELSQRVKKNKKTFSIGKLVALVSCCVVLCVGVLGTVLLLNRTDDRRYADDGTNCEIIALQEQETFDLLAQHTMITTSVLQGYQFSNGIGYALTQGEYLALKLQIIESIIPLPSVITIIAVLDEQFDYTDHDSYTGENATKEFLRGVEVSYSSNQTGSALTEYGYFTSGKIRYYIQCKSFSVGILKEFLYNKILV